MPTDGPGPFHLQASYAHARTAESIPSATTQSAGSMSAEHFAKLDALAPLSNLPVTIMLNGQSNMAAGPAQTFGYSELTSLLGADVLGFGQTAQAMVPAVDGTCNARANHGGIGAGAGPGLGQVGTRLARLIAGATGSTVRTYSLAYSGQPIAYFRKGSATKAFFEDGSQHPTLNNYDLLKSYVTATGIVPQLYVWIQGEANAGLTPDAYYTELAAHWADLQVDYPGVRMLIVGTIQASPGLPDDTGGIGGSTVAGVRLAQKRLAAEKPARVLYVDTTDLRGYTAWWYSSHYSTYGTTYAGYEEVALRIFAKLRGESDRPTVVAAQHPQQTFAFDHAWGSRRSLLAGGALALWSDDVGADSLAVETGTPEHVPSSPYFGDRSVIRFDHTASESLTEASIAGGNKWVLYVVARFLKSSINGTSRCLWQVETATVGGNRLAFMLNGSGAHVMFLNGASTAFAGPPACEGDVAHSYCVTYDGAAGEMALYIDGFPVSAVSGVANIDTGALARIRIGSLSGGLHFGGEIGFLACKATPAAMPTAAEVSAMHAGSRVEFHLET